MATFGRKESIQCYVNNILSRAPKERSFETRSARSIDGGDRAARIRELGRRGLPDYPGTSFVPELVIPPPAQLKRGSEAYDLVRMVANAYRTACRIRYETQSRFMLHGRLGTHRSYRSVLTAADTMCGLGVAPLAWCLFSFDVWETTVSTGRAPSVRWTFSKKRLAIRHEWFEDVKERYSTPRTRIAPKHEALLREWHEMWDVLMRYGPTTRDEVLDIVDLFFPGESFENWVIHAKAEVVRMQCAIDQVTAEGGLWDEY